MSHAKFGGRIVRDPREIPFEWVRLAELSNREDGRETDEYKAVYRACCTGEIPSDKCCKYKQTDRDSRGPIYADRDAVDAVLKRLKESQERGVPVRAAGAQVMIHSALASLLDEIKQIHAKVDRLL